MWNTFYQRYYFCSKPNIVSALFRINSLRLWNFARSSCSKVETWGAKWWRNLKLVDCALFSLFPVLSIFSQKKCRHPLSKWFKFEEESQNQNYFKWFWFTTKTKSLQKQMKKRKLSLSIKTFLKRILDKNPLFKCYMFVKLLCGKFLCFFQTQKPKILTKMLLKGLDI